ncbi:MAG: PAS domain-containing protein, partial [Candidatus Didemnitutus sp.]|nr:PAS domain-containing protein [Candidatus Didemnitutus sp.]
MAQSAPIRRRLLKLTLTVALPLGGMVVLALFQQFQADRKEALGAIHYIQEVNARALAAQVTKIRENLAYLANHPRVRSLDPTQAEALLREFSATHPEVIHARLLDKNLKLVSAVEGLSPELMAALAALPVYREAALAPAGHISAPYQGIHSKRWACFASHPVLDDNGGRAGTLILPLNLQQLSSGLVLPKNGGKISVGVIDADGLILLRLPEPEKFIGTFRVGIAHLRERLAAGERFDLELPGADGLLRTASFVPLAGTPWILYASVPTQEIYGDAWFNLWRTLAVSAVIVLFGGWLLLRSTGIIANPIKALTAAANAQVSALSEKPVAVEGPAEVAELAQAFNRMNAARRQAEARLVQSEHRYRTVIDQTGQMIYDLDYATNTAQWFGAEATLAITGYTLDEFQSVDLARWEAMIHPEDRARAIAAMDRSIAEHKLYSVEYRFRHKDGTYRHIEDHGIFLFNPDGSPNRWLGRLSDVTARHLALAALVESELRYRTVLDQTGQMIFDLAVTTGEIRWFGPTALRDVIGITPEEFSREGMQGWKDRLHPEDRDEAVARLERSLQTGEPCRGEYRLRHNDGTYRPVSERAVVLRNADGAVTRLVGRMTDITVRRIAEEQQRQFERRFLETQKLESLGVLAGGIAHDFNNLLTGILGNASLARLDLPPGSQCQSSLEQIETSARRAADLCRQMLAYSGKGRFVVQNLDLNSLVNDTTHLLGISISKTCILRFNLAERLPSIRADATQLRQIVMNLVINASEAIGARSGVIALATGVSRIDQDYLSSMSPDPNLTPGDYVFLEVSDNGDGMTAETITRIFDPFFTTKFTGRGLGLAAVQGIIRGHQGAIKVYSEPGRGTTFRLLLPCATGPADSLPGVIDPVEQPVRGSGHVLVVDDEETIRNVAARIIEGLGYTAEVASDGREAMAKYRADPARYQIVLLDLTMPHLDGEETFRQLRHLNPGVRVVLMSGFSEHE